MLRKISFLVLSVFIRRSKIYMTADEIRVEIQHRPIKTQ